MSDAAVNIDALLNSSDEIFLEETGWMSDRSPHELQVTYSDFSGRFQAWLAKLSEKLGTPTVTRAANPQVAEDLYFEAFELAAWPKGPGFLVLACGQHDRETPVFISFGYREAHAA